VGMAAAEAPVYLYYRLPNNPVFLTIIGMCVRYN